MDNNDESASTSAVSMDVESAGNHSAPVNVAAEPVEANDEPMEIGKHMENEEDIDLTESDDDDDEDYEPSDFESISNAASSEEEGFEEVPDPFVECAAGSDLVEVDEKNTEQLFQKTQQNLRAWNDEPSNAKLKKIYFKSVHDLLLTSCFLRLRKNPYTLDWNAQRRRESQLNAQSSTLRAYFITHFQLTKLVHNSVPHYLQVLSIAPSRTALWQEFGDNAVKLGDWKHAEFAYRKYLQFGGNKTKALQNIALLHFVSGDFLMTLDALKQLFAHQPRNAVAHVLREEISNIKGVWELHISQTMIQLGISKKRDAIPEEKTNMVREKIQKFRNNMKPACMQCVHDRKIMAEPVLHFVLNNDDALFCNFGSHLLQFYNEEFVKNPKALISVEYPRRQAKPDESPRVEEYRIPSPLINDYQAKGNVDIAIIIEEYSQNPPPAKKQKPRVSSNVAKAKKSVKQSYLSVLVFLRKLAGDRARRTQFLSSFSGMASIFDRLLLYIINKDDTDPCTLKPRDANVFLALYRKWWEILKNHPRIRSLDSDAIHSFAAKVGSRRALHLVNREAYMVCNPHHEDGPSLDFHAMEHPSQFNMDLDVDQILAENPDSPEIEAMIRMYKRMKTNAQGSPEL